MKKSIRITALALSTLLLGASLVGCGNGGNTSSGSSTSGSTSSSSSTSIAPTSWTSSEEEIMKKYLEGTVLPYTSVAGKLEYDSQSESVSFSSSKSSSQSKVDSWAQLLVADGFTDEDDADGDHLLRKALSSGNYIGISAYIYDNIFYFDAYLLEAPVATWTTTQKDTIESETEAGFELPFLALPGNWETEVYEGTLYIYSNFYASTQDLDRYATLLENDGYSLSLDEYDDPVGTKVLESGAEVTVNAYIGYYYNMYITVDYMMAVNEWPATQISEFLGSGVTTVVPEFTWTKYLLPKASEELFCIEVVDEVTTEKTEQQVKAETEDAYKAVLESANWYVMDDYYASEGLYIALDIQESVQVAFGWSNGKFEIMIGKYTNPYAAVADWAAVQTKISEKLIAGTPVLPDLSALATKFEFYYDEVYSSVEIRLSNSSEFDFDSVKTLFSTFGFDVDDSKTAQSGYVVATKDSDNASVEVDFSVVNDMPASWPNYLILSVRNIAAPGEFDLTTTDQVVTNSGTKVEFKSGKATFGWSQGGSSTPANNYVASNGQSRVYAKMDMTISVEAGYKINSIALITTSASLPSQMPTVIDGWTVTFDAASKTINLIPTAEASSVTFTLAGTSGNIKLTAAKVSYSAI